MLAVVLAVLAGCTTIREGARRARASDSIPGRTGTARSSTSTKTSTTSVLKPVATVYADVVPQRVPAQRHQLLQQLRRRLVGDQQHAAGQVRRPASRTRRGSARTRCSACSASSTSHRRWASSITTRTSARRSATTASAPAPTSCCRSSARRPCATRRRLPLDRLASPPALLRRHRHAGRPHAAADRQHPRRPARRDPRDRRHLARQVHLRSRRLPAAAAQPGLRRRRARDAGQAAANEAASAAAGAAGAASGAAAGTVAPPAAAPPASAPPPAAPASTPQ